MAFKLKNTFEPLTIQPNLITAPVFPLKTSLLTGKNQLFPSFLSKKSLNSLGKMSSRSLEKNNLKILLRDKIKQVSLRLEDSSIQFRHKSANHLKRMPKIHLDKENLKENIFKIRKIFTPRQFYKNSCRLTKIQPVSDDINVSGTKIIRLIR
jgi:hypothetical protein